MKLKLQAIALLILLGCSSCRGVDFKNSVTESSTFQRFAKSEDSGELKPFPSEVALKLHRLLNRSVRENKLPGMVMYIATSNGVWQGAVGKADLESGAVLKSTDRFRTANLTELFVSIAVLQLVEEGRLTLDESLSHWRPELSQSLPEGKRITIRQLLNHTSGLDEPYNAAFGQLVAADPTHRWTAKEVLQSMLNQPARAPRGSFAYSNANYLLLQLVVEKATGSPLEQVLQEHIIAPLELKNTFLELHSSGALSFAQGYEATADNSSFKNVTKPLLNTGLGLGDRGVISNLPDATRLFRALFQENRLLSSDSLQQMLNPVENGRGGYGLGISHQQTLWGEGWGSVGNMSGFSSAIIYLPVHDLTIGVWTNRGNGKQDDSPNLPLSIAEAALEIILGQP